MYTICLPDTGCPEFRYYDRLIDRPVLLVTTRGQEFDVIARPGYGIATFSIPKSVLDDYCETNLDCPLDRFLHLGDGVIPVNPEMVINLRAMALELSSCAQRSSDSSGQLDPVQSLESQLLENLLRSLRHEDQTKHPAW
jgi:hypothetical protein